MTTKSFRSNVTIPASPTLNDTMAQQQRTDLLFPVGRMVAGDLYEPRTEDAEGKPLTIKNGPDAGKARVDFFFAVAIPKKPGEQAWWQTDWGQKIMAVGAAAFPQQYQVPAFAWKIEDGDSQAPNMKGRKNADREGYPGSWVVKFSGGYAPRIVSADGSQQITEKGAVKCGYFVQVFANVTGNASAMKPGIYINHTAVALAGYGPEIVQGPDLSAVGFGQGVTLPPGASATPVGGGFNPAPAMSAAVAALPGVPGLPAMPAMPGAVPAVAPAMAMPAAAAPPLAVAPNPAFLAVPGAVPAMPAAPAMPPAAPAEPSLTPKGVATGFTYAQYKAANWTDDVLRAQGLIV